METGLEMQENGAFSRKKSKIHCVRLRVLEMLGQMQDYTTGSGPAWTSNARWKGTPDRERGESAPGGQP